MPIHPSPVHALRNRILVYMRVSSERITRRLLADRLDVSNGRVIWAMHKLLVNRKVCIEGNGWNSHYVLVEDAAQLQGSEKENA